MAEGIGPSFHANTRGCEGRICLQSFRWCGFSNDGRTKTCEFPQDIWPSGPETDDNVSGLLQSDKEYTISWKDADDKFPVMVEWRFAMTTSGDAGDRNPVDDVVYIKNVTDASSYTFKFDDIFNSFPTSEFTNITPPALRGLATSPQGVVIVSQPERNGDEGAWWWGDVRHLTDEKWSDQSSFWAVGNKFQVQFAEQHARIAVVEATRKWRLILGLAGGVPILVLMILVAVLGSSVYKAKKRIRSLKGKAVE